MDCHYSICDTHMASTCRGVTSKLNLSLLHLTTAALLLKYIFDRDRNLNGPNSYFLLKKRISYYNTIREKVTLLDTSNKVTLPFRHFSMKNYVTIEVTVTQRQLLLTKSITATF